MRSTRLAMRSVGVIAICQALFTELDIPLRRVGTSHLVRAANCFSYLIPPLEYVPFGRLTIRGGGILVVMPYKWGIVPVVHETVDLDKIQENLGCVQQATQIIEGRHEHE